MKESPLSNILRINRYHRRALKCTMDPYQYVGVMHLIVLYLHRYPGASQEEITSFYALDKTSVARDARRLEDLGHIQRRIIPENRRQYQMFLTEEGENMVGVIDRATEEFQEKLTDGISREDWQQLTLLLGRLVENVCPPPGKS